MKSDIKEVISLIFLKAVLNCIFSKTTINHRLPHPAATAIDHTKSVPIRLPPIIDFPSIGIMSKHTTWFPSRMMHEIDPRVMYDDCFSHQSFLVPHPPLFNVHNTESIHSIAERVFQLVWHWAEVTTTIDWRTHRKKLIVKSIGQRRGGKWS